MVKISAEMIQEFLRLHRQGIPYRAIGRTHKVDPRTVKSRVDKAAQEGEKEHWEAVSSQLDIRYLEEHHRILTRVSIKLLDIVQTEPMFVRFGDKAEKLLDRMIYAFSESCEDMLVSRGAELEPSTAANTLLIPDSMGRDPKERLGKRLWDSLKEHEPELKEGVEVWVKLWDRFQRQRTQLGRQAIGLIKKKKPELKDASSGLVQGLADTAILQGVHGFEAASLHIRETSEAKFKVFMGDVPVGVEFEMKSVDSSEVLSACQSLLDDQLCHRERLRPIVDAYERLKEALSKLEGQVDSMVIRGRPNGTCSLCPAYGLSI